MKILFFICAGILFVISKITGHPYQEVSVWINVYFQALFLLISALLLLVFAFRSFRDYTGVFLLILPWVTIQIIAFYVFEKRYFFKPYPTVFNDTMKGLQDLAKFLHSDYFSINIILYVFVYFSVICVDFALILLIKRLTKRHKTEREIEKSV